MPLPSCHIRLGCCAPQLSQIAAGFTLLAQQKRLRIQSTEVAPLLYPHPYVLEADFGRGNVFAYDVTESYAQIPCLKSFDANLSHVARYFKRGHVRDLHDGLPNSWKLRPLGLGLHVTCRGNFFDTLTTTPCPFSAEDYMSHNSYPAYKILFIVQLLPQHNKQAKQTNQLYINSIHACKEAFGADFHGGLLDCAIARKIAPELVLPASQTRQAHLLQQLKGNFICVAAPGQFAQLCAAGRAIVTTPFDFGLPGPFARARNYVTYDSPESCLARLNELLESTPAVHRMEAANFTYFTQFIRPDAMVLHTLQDGLSQFFT